MRSLATLFCSALLCTAALAQDTPPERPAEPTPKEPVVLQLGKRPDGDIALSDLDGTEFRAAQLMGKVTVVNFYSIQCPVQAAWDQRLAHLQRDFEEAGVVFLHIDSNVTEIGKEPPPPPEGDEKPYATIREHLAKKGLPFRVLVDHGNKVADLFGATCTPHVFVFGSDGRLVYKGLVDDDQRDKNKEGRKNHLRDVLDKLTQGETVEPFATRETGCGIKRANAPKRPRRGGRGGERDGR